MKKVNLEFHKEKFKKYFNFLSYFENLSYFKLKNSWIVDIYISNLFDEKLINVFFKEENKGLINIKNIDWIRLNADSDKLTKTELFSITQGSKKININSKYHLIIPANIAFGTGSHSSTLLLIKNIEIILKKIKINSSFDLGSGSGILSLVLKKFKIKTIIASDNDEGVIPVINENRKKNNLSSFITLNCSEFKNRLLVNKKFDLIVANLFFNILKKLCLQFSLRLKKGGYLIVSGIVKKQVVELKNIYIKLNFKIIKISYEKDWVSIVFKKMSRR